MIKISRVFWTDIEVQAQLIKQKGTSQFSVVAINVKEQLQDRCWTYVERNTEARSSIIIAVEKQ